MQKQEGHHPLLSSHTREKKKKLHPSQEPPWTGEEWKQTITYANYGI